MGCPHSGVHSIWVSITCMKRKRNQVSVWTHAPSAVITTTVHGFKHVKSPSIVSIWERWVMMKKWQRGRWRGLHFGFHRVQVSIMCKEKKTFVTCCWALSRHWGYDDCAKLHTSQWNASLHMSKAQGKMKQKRNKTGLEGMLMGGVTGNKWYLSMQHEKQAMN